MRRSRFQITHALQRFGIVYCVGAVVFILVAPYVRQIWWLALANDVAAPFVFLPVPALALLALLSRSRTLGLASAATAVVFAVVFHSALLPPAQPTGTGMPLRAMTYNQLFANQQPAAVVAAIRRQQADIVAIQELSPSVAAAIQRDLSGSYPYQWLLPDDGSIGLGLLSRFPFEQQIRLRASRSQQVRVQTEAGSLTVINTHPSVPFVNTGGRGLLGSLNYLETYATSARQEQIASLLQTIDTLSGPLIVLGDFNTSDRDPLYAAVASRMRDAYRDGAWGFGTTFPRSFRLGPVITPLVRIDYIWTRGPTAQRAYVDCDSGGSDHCLVVAALVLPK